MRTMSSRGKSPQTTTADGGAISSAPEAKETNETPRYETYEVQRVREIEQQRAILRNELLLLHRTCENIMTLRAIKREVPTEVLLYAPLQLEMDAIGRELKRLDRMQTALYSYAPAGLAYRRILRRVAQFGLTHYHLRARTHKPARFVRDQQ
jgi:hypothetical protein